MRFNTVVYLACAIGSSYAQIFTTYGTITSGKASAFSTSINTPTITPSTSRFSTTAVQTTSSSASSSDVDDGNDDIITKAFQAPSGCTDHATQSAGHTDLWQNAVHPAPSVTIGSCLPRQFVKSALSPTNLPPFKQLVCPMGWESFDWNSTYVICCPRNFEMYLPFVDKTDRPGLNALCTSLAASGIIIDITSYSSNGATTQLVSTVSTTEGTVIWAYGFDGTAYKPSEVASTGIDDVASTDRAPAASTDGAHTASTSNGPAAPKSKQHSVGAATFSLSFSIMVGLLLLFWGLLVF